MNNSEWVLDARNVSYAYGGKTLALQDVSLRIARGSKATILGANGAGKSTLFLHFNGILRPRSGEILFDGAPISYRAKDLGAIRERVAVVLQNPDDQIFSSTVEEDVAFGPMNLGIPRSEVDKRTEEALTLTGLSKMRERSTQQLSFGQRKRVALAGALAMRPQVLVMDEPTAGLDTHMVGEIMELTDKLNEQGMTIVISTHDVDLAYCWSDSVHVLDRGRAVFSGTPEGFFNRPRDVNDAGLVVPSMYEINRLAMASLDLPEHPHPKTSSELLAKMSKCRPGRLFVDQGGNGGSAPPHATAGIYGPMHRAAAAAGELNIEYSYNGLEGCLGEVLLGRDAVLVLDPGLKSQVERKLDRLDKVFGQRIETLWD